MEWKNLQKPTYDVRRENSPMTRIHTCIYNTVGSTSHAGHVNATAWRSIYAWLGHVKKKKWIKDKELSVCKCKHLRVGPTVWIHKVHPESLISESESQYVHTQDIWKNTTTYHPAGQFSRWSAYQPSSLAHTWEKSFFFPHRACNM